MVATADWNGKEVRDFNNQLCFSSILANVEIQVIVKGDVPIDLPDRRDFEPKEKYPYRY